MTATIRIGTTGWAIPVHCAGAFASDGPVLARYARVLNAVEINSSFYRPHQRKTYQRWAATVPPDFRFAVKVPKAITHIARLRDCTLPAEAFLGEISNLGTTLGPLLLQLPPSFAFDQETVGPFCEMLSQDGRFQIACEPRHATWFTPNVERWLADRRIARVAADPACHPSAAEPGGWGGLSYYRWHGSPKNVLLRIRAPYPRHTARPNGARRRHRDLVHFRQHCVRCRAPERTGAPPLTLPTARRQP